MFFFSPATPFPATTLFLIPGTKFLTSSPSHRFPSHFFNSGKVGPSIGFSERALVPFLVEFHAPPTLMPHGPAGNARFFFIFLSIFLISTSHDGVFRYPPPRFCVHLLPFSLTKVGDPATKTMSFFFPVAPLLHPLQTLIFHVFVEFAPHSRAVTGPSDLLPVGNYLLVEGRCMPPDTLFSLPRPSLQ